MGLDFGLISYVNRIFMILHMIFHDVSSSCFCFMMIFGEDHMPKKTYIDDVHHQGNSTASRSELNWKASSSREDFHREKHYDFCSKQVPNSAVVSSNFHHSCVTFFFSGVPSVYELLQVLSVYTTFPRFLFPREDHRGKEQQLA